MENPRDFKKNGEGKQKLTKLPQFKEIGHVVNKIWEEKTSKSMNGGAKNAPHGAKKGGFYRELTQVRRKISIIPIRGGGHGLTDNMADDILRTSVKYAFWLKLS